MSSDETSMTQARGTAAMWTLVLLLALGHAAVDAAGNFAIARISGIAAMTDYATAWWLTQAYNLLAFSPQVLLGWAADRTRLWLGATVLGCVLAAAACVLDPASARTAVALTGAGNALFHVGAGGLVMQMARGRAAMAGVLVGPGDLGVVLGVWLGRSGAAAGMALSGTTLTLAAAVLVLGAPRTRHAANEATRLDGPAIKTATPQAHGGSAWSIAGVLALFCLPVALRSVMGSAVLSPWNGSAAMLLSLAIAATLAKVLGGFLADRAGWIATTVPAALLAAPLLAFAAERASGAIAAMVLVQLAMPVTLTAMARAVPNRPAFAFGLAATCLSAASVPPMVGMEGISPAMLGVLQVACAASLLSGLVLLRRVENCRKCAASDEVPGLGARSPVNAPLHETVAGARISVPRRS